MLWTLESTVSTTFVSNQAICERGTSPLSPFSRKPQADGMTGVYSIFELVFFIGDVFAEIFLSAAQLRGYVLLARAG